MEETQARERTQDAHGEKQDANKSSIQFGLIFMFLGIVLISFIYFAYGKNAEAVSLSGNVALPVLFLFGLVTGLHCIGMCGSFVIAYSTKNEKDGKTDAFSHLKYGGGKLISYTLIGGIFGFVGSLIAFTPEIRGAIGILAGIFLLIYGLNMLNIFPALRKLQLRLPSFASMESTQGKGPFAIGLANGLFLACGPLQAMYVYAAGTGSVTQGALALLAFGAGTLPFMLLFGYSLSSLAKYLHKIIKFSGALVIVLGLVMANTGLTLLGHGITLIPGEAGNSTITNSTTQNVTEQVQTIKMTVNDAQWTPDTFNLQKGIKVHWVINAVKLASCGGEMIFPNYEKYMRVEGQLPSYAWVDGSTLHIKPNLGENVLEFTPIASGTWTWSCWMGMIPGRFIIN